MTGNNQPPPQAVANLPIIETVVAAVPATYEDMTAYVDDMIGCGRLRMSDVAQEVADLIIHRVVPARIKPIWHFVAFASVGTLDWRLRELYGFRWTSTQQRWLDMNLAVLRSSLPVIPNRFRTILPARWAEWRVADGEKSGARSDPGMANSR